MIATRDTCRVIAALHPFKMGAAHRIERLVPANLTVRQILRLLEIDRPEFDFGVSVGGDSIPRTAWDLFRPGPGADVAIRALPAGGDGENSGKDILRLALTVGGFAAGGWGGGWLAGRIGGLGKIGTSVLRFGGAAIVHKAATVLIDQFAPTPDQRQMEEPAVPTVNRENQLTPFAVFPKIYGEHLSYPPFGSLPYNDGDWVYLIYSVSLGHTHISDIKIANTPIEDLLTERTPENPSDQDGQYEIRYGDDDNEQPRSISPPSVIIAQYGDPVEDDLPEDSGWISRTTTETCNEFELWFKYTEGLGVEWRWQRWFALYLELEIQARPVGGGEFATLFVTEFFNHENHSDRPSGNSGAISWFRLRCNLMDAFDLSEPCRWEIRYRRGPNSDRVHDVPEDAELVVHDTVVLDEIHEITWVDVIKKKNVATIALLIPWKRESEDGAGEGSFYQSIDWTKLNCVGHSYLTYWNGSTWTYGLSKQPAAVYRDILTGSAAFNPLSVDRLNLEQLQEWAEYTDLKGYEFNAVFDRRRTVQQAIEAVCGVSRARPVRTDGKFGAVVDREQDGIVQLFTPRNSWGFRSIRRLPPLLHGIRCNYRKRLHNWQETEIVVYRDGYDENSEDATNIQKMDMWGACGKTQVELLAGYKIREHQLRLEKAQLQVDIENLVCTVGDLVGVSWDAPLQGVSRGRIKAVTRNVGGDVTSITVDNELPIDADNYVLYIRSAKDTEPFYQFIPTPAITYGGPPQFITECALSVPIPAGQPQPNEGDLFTWGKWTSPQNHTLFGRWLIDGIEPAEDLTATLHLIEYAPGMYDETILHSYEPEISDIPSIRSMSPAPPVVVLIQTDESVLYRASGNLLPQVVIALRYETGMYSPIEAVHVDWREWTEEGIENRPWGEGETFTGKPDRLYISKRIEQGRRYEFRIRTMGAGNMGSNWVHEDGDGEGVLVIGKSSPPPSPTGLILEQGLLRWGYSDTPPLDLAGFEIRRHAGSSGGWDNATKIDTVGRDNRQYALSGFLNGTHTFYVKAVDTSGNYSEEAAEFVAYFSFPHMGKIFSTIDWFTLGWPGTRENCYVHGNGTLRATDVGQQMIWTSESREIVAEPGYEDAIVLLYNTVLATAASWRFEYRRSSDAQWVPWPGVIRLQGGGAFQFRFILTPGGQEAYVQHFTTHESAELLEEVIEGSAHYAHPVTEVVNLTKQFTHITEVNGTLEQSAAAAYASCKARSAQGISGTSTIMVKAHKPDGQAADAIVTWQVRGYFWRGGVP